MARELGGEDGVSARPVLYSKNIRAYEHHGSTRRPKQQRRERELLWSELAAVRLHAVAMADGHGGNRR